MNTTEEPAEVTAYCNGWRQDDTGAWTRPGYASAPSAEEALRDDRDPEAA